MKENLTFKLLTEESIHEITVLGKQLNPKLTLEEIRNYLKEMFEFSNYYCFGIFLEENLIGVSSGWVTVRLYSGKQLEVDNVIIDNDIQSKGYGSVFFEFIEDWAKENGCKTIELNTYVKNSKSHKFYYNMGYSILGFHFWKGI